MTKPGEDGKLEQMRIIGGLLALGGGLLALLVVTVVALFLNPTNSAVATSAIGVIGSIVGAYFGVKIGTDGTAKAIDAQRAEAAKAQVFAANIPTEHAKVIVTQAEDAAARATSQPANGRNR